MSSHNLPPVQHLPQWTRVGRLGKPCSPRRLPANKLQPLPVAPPADRRVWRAAEVTCHSDMDPRVASVQRNIQFLQQQHKETLEKLHAEIEYLRRENKELQYKMIMEPPKSSRKGVTHSRRGIRPPTQGSEARTGLYLEEPLQDTRPSQDQALSNEEGSNILGCARQDHNPDAKGGLITSLQPLRIHSNPSHPPRAPTLQECEVIIRQLYNANSLQSQEIIRVKTLLRDIVLSKKITPENYILTKAYLVDGTSKSSEEKKFPKLGLQTFPEKTSGPPQSRVVLPALKQSLSSTIAERQRRTRAVQRDRFKRTVQ
ncbi:coiled-coil domain-containing protein 74B isoform X1 [Cottoperca gobio]|uniref:Coiled-coil domain-containing protein 74A-like isoform X1 n=1 Tax=Cottoperca gobio TaxID=56716 RepID=A0A6J2QNQ4_COTGO|nr:coiled-coil domain-containing protein 74A-like isoform X1 [Cottoperca gobio]XP_029300034.1 coiled-coil domain-containing protein 74A-like isoform X1 [Cottoperca gobio]